jgi:hypothetical protein
MSEVSIDWSSAEVREGSLRVKLRGRPPSDWRDGFDRTVALLPAGDWGKVRLKNDRIRVRRVRPGSEDRLRHFLESVVLQANSSSPEPPGSTQDTGTERPLDGVDAEMTERFRAFAARPR